MDYHKRAVLRVSAHEHVIEFIEAAKWVNRNPDIGAKSMTRAIKAMCEETGVSLRVARAVVGECYWLKKRVKR